jgi:NADPH:quinone reductase-like Zn-dependent oxidoreductase
MTANIQPGEVLLVHGGGSGIGTMAVQLGREVGARVAVTAGSPEKLEVCRELGASILVNYRTEDFEAVVREATDGHGADVILDTIGAKYLARNVGLLAVNGRLVVIGLQGGRTAEINLGAMLAKRCALVATTLRARPAAEKAVIVAAVREHVWPGTPDRARGIPPRGRRRSASRDGGLDPRRQTPVTGLNCPETLGYVAKIPPETIRTDYPGRLREYR